MLPSTINCAIDLVFGNIRATVDFQMTRTVVGGGVIRYLPSSLRSGGIIEPGAEVPGLMFGIVAREKNEKEVHTQKIRILVGNTYGAAV